MSGLWVLIFGKPYPPDGFQVGGVGHAVVALLHQFFQVLLILRYAVHQYLVQAFQVRGLVHGCVYLHFRFYVVHIQLVDFANGLGFDFAHLSWVDFVRNRLACAYRCSRCLNAGRLGSVLAIDRPREVWSRWAFRLLRLCLLLAGIGYLLAFGWRV